MKKTVFRVSRLAASITGTSASLRENLLITLEDLYYALMLPSGNDAALVLAENFGKLLYFSQTSQLIQMQ